MSKAPPPEFWIIILAFGCAIVAGIAKAYATTRAAIRRRAGVAPVATNSVATQQISNRNVAIDNTPVAAPRGMQLVTLFTPEQRQHTIVAAKTGDGKTTTLNTLLVHDVARGYNVVVCNPHFTYWHPTDQPIDLRPLRQHFAVVYDYAEIAATLESLCNAIEERKPMYRDGLDVGACIVLYIDEWPAIAEEPAYSKRSIAAVQKIIREGRKYNIFVALFAQDALIDTLGFKSGSGIRANFATRLLGNVDRTTWNTLTNNAPQQPVAKGTWFASGNIAPDGGNGIVVGVQRPTAQDIAAVAKVQPVAVIEVARTPQQQTNNVGDSELEVVARWLSETPQPGKRAIARRLYKLRGGAGDYSGDGPLFYEACHLIEQAETLLTE